MTAVDLAAEAVAIRELRASVLDATSIGTYAVEAAAWGWKVGPLCQHEPFDPVNPRRRRKIVGPYGKDPVGHLVPHGVLDFTDDVDTAIRWWSQGILWNIGARVPGSMFVLDIDPRHGGLESVRKLGDLPPTLMTVSGRGDGGVHYFYRRPVGKLSAKHLGPGIDIKTDTGYVVLAPSIHPDSGRRYVRVDAPVAAPPAWLVNLVVDRPKAAPPRRPLPAPGFCRGGVGGPSVADEFSASVSWSKVLEPHGWQCLDADPDADGAVWLHPRATSACSATVKHGCLFVYTPNTPFDVTEASDPHGYTKFRAYAVLNHSGNMSVAARALRAAAR